MWWPSTLLGAGAGFAVASIPGALLGGLLGQAMDRRLRVRCWADLVDRLRGHGPLGDEELLFVLLGRLAKSEGRIEQSHVRQAREEMQRLNLSEPARLRAIEAFNRGKAGKDRLGHHLRRIKQQAHASEGTVRACWRMVWADGKAGRREQALLADWGAQLGLGRLQVQALARDYAPGTARPDPIEKPALTYAAALRLLGVAATSEPGAIKQAYRRLLSQHHPDKLQGRGASAAQVRAATERTRELHLAYAVVRKRHGL